LAVTPARSRHPVVLALAAVVAAATVWAFAPGLSGAFVLDDVRAIVRNPTIRTLTPLSTPLSPPGQSTVSGRPVANFTFAVTYALAPDDAREVFAPRPGDAGDDAFLRNSRTYHGVNLAIHIAAALVLFGVLRRTFESGAMRPRIGDAAPWLAFVIALIWAVHPLQTESVTYVVQRVESLMGLFYLLTLYCAIRASEGPRPGLWTVLAVVSCALGMGSKEVMVTAPVIVALWHFIFRHDRPLPWARLAVIACGWIVFAVLVSQETRSASIASDAAIAWRYLLTQTEVVLHYLRLAVVPSPLVLLYDWPLVTTVSSVLPEAIVLVAAVAATVFAVARRHALGFAGAWFFVILAPTSSIVPIVTEVAAEHRMYLPLAAVISCLVVAAFVAGRKLTSRSSGDAAWRAATVVSVIATATIVASYGITTRARSRDYLSEAALWSANVAAHPQGGRGRVAYAAALASAQNLAEAETQLRAALALDPNDPVANTRLGSVLAAQNRFDEAVPHLERALASRPDDVDAHRFLAQIFMARREDRRAVPHLKRLAELVNDNPQILARLAATLVDSADPLVRNSGEAVGYAERAVRLTGRRDPQTLEILSVAQAGAGRLSEAAATAREGLAIARAQGNQSLAARLERRAAVYESAAK
jgi:cytochrome c-type biogenesis protein CcmH/NrfG